MVLRADPSRLLVSQIAEAIARDCDALAKTFRGPGALPRGDQMVRASLSVVSNLAEACGRGTVPDFRRFLLHARGSAQELLAQLRVIVPAGGRQRTEIHTIRNRTVLVLKLVNRLYEHPPRNT